MRMKKLTLCLIVASGAAPAFSNEASDYEACRQAIVAFEPMATSEEREKYREIERYVVERQVSRELSVAAEQDLRSFHRTTPAGKRALISVMCRPFEIKIQALERWRQYPSRTDAETMVQCYNMGQIIYEGADIIAETSSFSANAIREHALFIMEGYDQLRKERNWKEHQDIFQTTVHPSATPDRETALAAWKSNIDCYAFMKEGRP